MLFTQAEPERGVDVIVFCFFFFFAHLNEDVVEHDGFIGRLDTLVHIWAASCEMSPDDMTRDFE